MISRHAHVLLISQYWLLRVNIHSKSLESLDHRAPWLLSTTNDFILITVDPINHNPRRVVMYLQTRKCLLHFVSQCLWVQLHPHPEPLIECPRNLDSAFLVWHPSPLHSGIHNKGYDKHMSFSTPIFTYIRIPSKHSIRAVYNCQPLKRVYKTHSCGGRGVNGKKRWFSTLSTFYPILKKKNFHVKLSIWTNVDVYTFEEGVWERICFVHSLKCC